MPARSRALPLAQSGQRHAAGFAFVALDLEGLRSGGWVYVRVVQEDGHAAWSSPVFLR